MYIVFHDPDAVQNHHGAHCRNSLKGRRVYIDAEEKGLRETLETLIREESWKPMEDATQTNVLRSASELFAVIKKSLQRCSRFVSRGDPMLRLMGAFQAISQLLGLHRKRLLLHESCASAPSLLGIVLHAISSTTVSQSLVIPVMGACRA